jgi:hypothetical protein
MTVTGIKKAIPIERDGSIESENFVLAEGMAIRSGE